MGLCWQHESGSIMNRRRGIIQNYIETGIPLPENVGAYWKFTEESGDFVDTAGNLTLARTGTLSTVSGIIDSAISGFATTPNYAGVNYNASWNIADANKIHAVEAWVKITTNSSRQIIFANTNNPVGSVSNGALFMSIEGSNNLLYGSFDANGQVQYNIGTSLNDGDWHYIVGIYDGTASPQYELWIDNSQVATASFSVAHANANGQIQVGLLNSGVEPFNNIIDEIVFWYGGKPTSEIISERWNSGNGKAYKA